MCVNLKNVCNDNKKSPFLETVCVIVCGLCVNVGLVTL